MRRLCLLWLSACVPDMAPSPSPPTVDEVDEVDVVMTTISNDYAVGSLSAVRRSDSAVFSDLASVHSDAVVRWSGGVLWQINRLRMDTVRRYELGSWVEPVFEVSLGQGSNPHDAVVCGERLVVSRYERSALSLLDLDSGELLGELELEAYADDDGVPEASDLVVIDERVYVGLQRLRRDQGWVPSDTGRVVEVDCSTWEVTGAFDVGPNPVLRPLPSEPGVVMVIADDGVARLDVDDGSLAPLSWLGDVEGVVVDGAWNAAGEGLLISRVGAAHHTTCVDLASGSTADGPRFNNYLSSVDMSEDGQAWIAARQSWEDPSTLGGLVVLDTSDCVDETDGDWLRTTLAPFSVEVL